jgi:transcriptional regulator with XRE-family HTH domain
MTQKRPKPVPIADAMALNIRMRREAVELTQSQLAVNMVNAGFSSWTRTTVSEVEGNGRGRSVSLPELMALAVILRVSCWELLCPHPSAAVEISPGLSAEPHDLISLLVSTDIVTTHAEVIATSAVQKELRRLQSIYSERMAHVADEIRGVAGWFESESKSLIFGEWEDTK